MAIEFARKRWTEEDDAKIMEHVQTYSEMNPTHTKKQMFRALSDVMGEPPASINARWYRIQKEQAEKEKEDTTKGYNDFLSSLQQMRDAYEALKHENIQLRQRVTSLEHDLKEFEVVAKVMEKARKLVVHEELGEVQPNRFKMAANGDLQRY
jgi:hypothetical protein